MKKVLSGLMSLLIVSGLMSNTPSFAEDDDDKAANRHDYASGMVDYLYDNLDNDRTSPFDRIPKNKNSWGFDNIPGCIDVILDVKDKMDKIDSWSEYLLKWYEKYLGEKYENGELAADEITDENVNNSLIEAARATMTEEDFKNFTAVDGKYKLYFIDSYAILVRDGILLALDSTEVDPLTGEVLMKPAEKVFKQLDNVFVAVNTRNEALNQIDDFMIKYGYWGYTDDVVVITKESSEQSYLFNSMAGNDTYTITKNCDRIIINDYCENNSGNDTINFDYDVTEGVLYFYRDEMNLYFNDEFHGNWIMIKDYFNPNKCSVIENIQISEDIVLDYDYVCRLVNNVIGTDDDDELIGYSELSFVVGYDGDDKITCYNGNNLIFSDGGNDEISTGNGDNLVFGDSGDDRIECGSGTDIIIGGEGDDYLCGKDGDDIYLYRLGDGNDVVNESKGFGVVPYGGTDILYFDKGIFPEKTTVERSGSDIIIHVNGNEGSVTLPGIYQTGFSPLLHPFDYVVFYDETIWDFEKLLDLSRYVCGTEGDDEINFNLDFDGVIKGLDGDDIIICSNGNDEIYGGPGNDTMNGKDGSDTYYYELGDGNDIIDEGRGGYTYPYGGDDKVILGEGILPSETKVHISKDDYTLTLEFVDGGTIAMTGNVVSGFTKIFPMDHILFADGTEWTLTELLAKAAFYGTDDDDEITDTSSDNVIYCGKGNDKIYGTGGADTYIYEYGDGQDYIYDRGNIWGSGGDVLKLTGGITIDDIYFEIIRGNESIIYIHDTDNSIRIDGIDSILFDDETELSVSELSETAKSAEDIKTDVMGDVNSDGEMNIADVVCVQKWIINDSDFLINWKMCDIDEDGSITVYDMIIMKQLITNSLKK